MQDKNVITKTVVYVDDCTFYEIDTDMLNRAKHTYYHTVYFKVYNIDGKYKAIPLNPMIGMNLLEKCVNIIPSKHGKGDLKYLGPNFATDCIITKIYGDNLMMVAINRKDTKDDNIYAFVGGMIEPNEFVREACVREFEEEAGVNVNLFKDETRAKIIYEGYVDDPRNTENSWIETVAIHLMLEKEEEFKLKAGSDARNVKYITIATKRNNKWEMNKNIKYYASHGGIVHKMIQMLNNQHLHKYNQCSVLEGCFYKNMYNNLTKMVMNIQKST